MSEKSVNVRIGPGFPALLTLLFVGLKLTGYLSWPWLWVLSPLWIGFAVVMTVFVGVVIVAALVSK